MTRGKFYFNTLKTIAIGVISSVICFMLVKYSPAVCHGIQMSVERCINIIIPSLFAFMAVSQMIIKSGAAKYITIPLRPVAKYVFRIPDELFTVFLISCIAGYPVGVKLLSDMLEEGRIDKRTAENMSAVCFCGGPAFYSGTVGLAVFGSTKIGLLIFVSVAGANLISAILIGQLTRPHVLSDNKECPFTAKDICECVNSSGRAMFTICSMIVFCCALISVLEEMGMFDAIQKLTGITDNAVTALKGCFEISYISRLRNRPYYLLPIVCAVCSFGGICIIAQLYAVKSSKLGLKKFLMLRPVSCVLSAGLCCALRPYFVNEAIEVSVINADLYKVNNFIPSICLILMIFLLNLKKSLVFSE